MQKPLQITNPDELARIDGLAALPPFNPDDLVRHAPDAHWVLLEADGAVLGRCSLWWSNTPPYPNHRLGLIGHYAVTCEGAARQLLEHACEQLAIHECTLAVGPMDGTTWRRYRFIVERGSEPAFFLEPDNPADWPAHFVEEGFTPLANYYSALNDKLDYEDPRAKQAERRLHALSIRLRPIDLSCFEEELRRIYQMVARSFRNGFLYTPLSEAEFLAEYRKLEPHLRPELIMLAEQQSRTVGFIFTLPDLLQARRQQVVDTAIIKTLAVLPELALGGLGSYLVARNQLVARSLGFRRIIHALMHESNTSRNISARYGSTFRRYTLFAKPL